MHKEKLCDLPLTALAAACQKIVNDSSRTDNEHKVAEQLVAQFAHLRTQYLMSAKERQASSQETLRRQMVSFLSRSVATNNLCSGFSQERGGWSIVKQPVTKVEFLPHAVCQQAQLQRLGPNLRVVAAHDAQSTKM
jgi:hypothetical protein